MATSSLHSKERCETSLAAAFSAEQRSELGHLSGKKVEQEQEGAIKQPTEPKESAYSSREHYTLHALPHPVELGWKEGELFQFSRVLFFYSQSKRFPVQEYDDVFTFGGVDRRVFSNLYEDDVRIRLTPLLDAGTAQDLVNFPFLYTVPAPSTEHLFQAMKCLYEADARFIMEELDSDEAARYGQSRMELTERQVKKLVELGADPEEFKHVTSKTGKMARMRGIDGKLPRRADWNEIKHFVMLHLVRIKFAGAVMGSCAKQAVKALGTDIPLFVEHTKNDSTWADAADGSGTNLLGKCLTQTFLELTGQAAVIPILPSAGAAERLRTPNSDIVEYQITSDSFKKKTANVLREEANLDPPPSPDCLLVLDFEAICERHWTPRPQEIIEWTTLLLNAKTGRVESEFHHHIKPDLRPQLSDFCTELTGVTQPNVDLGDSLECAMELHQQWLNENNLVCLYDKNHRAGKSDVTTKRTFLYLTWGDWGLKTALPNQLKYHESSVPSHFSHWVNVKIAFEKLYNTQASDMAGMLNQLGLELEVQRHSGIDNCRNVARSVRVLLQNNWIPVCTSDCGFQAHPTKQK